MKKLFGILAALAVVLMPLGAAKADGFRNYSKGELVSFKQDKDVADDDNAHIQTFIALEDSPSDQQYARVWGGTGIIGVPGKNMTFTTGEESYKTSLIYNATLTSYNQIGGNYLDSTTLANADYISLEELKSIFDMTENAGAFTVDITKYAKRVEFFQKQMEGANLSYNIVTATTPTAPAIKGYFTSTLSEDKTQVYAIEFTYGEEYNITGMTIKLVPITSGEYVGSLVVSADKTFDCMGKPKMCYLCNNEYIYTEVGTQDPTCTEAADKPSANECVTNAKTGTKEYIVEGLAVIGVAIVTLAVLKRKDLFRNI